MEREFHIHGRTITQQMIDHIGDLRVTHPDWSRRALSQEVCRIWNWRDAKGRLRDMACRNVLLRLHQAGQIVLPSPRHNGNNERRHCNIPLIPHDTQPILGCLSDITPLELLIPQTGSGEDKLFKFLLHHYHYLGFKHVPGENMAYLALDRHQRPLAGLLFAAAAWKTAERDQFIGWSPAIRQDRLRYVTNNARFLILPWVDIKCLASHILASVCRRIRSDWCEKYGHPVHLLETFVERSRFQGICCRASNWRCVGTTTGRTRNDRYNRIKTSVKDIYVFPLCKHFRRELCYGAV